MISLVGGSGVFSGPTKGQYQQHIADQAVAIMEQGQQFREAKRQAVSKEIYDLALKEAEAQGVNVSVILSDEEFQKVAAAKMGNLMGGPFGLGGGARLDRMMEGWSGMYSGSAGEQEEAFRALSRKQIKLGTDSNQTTDFNQAGYKSARNALLQPPPAPGGTVPGPGPGPGPGPSPAPAPGAAPALTPDKNPPQFWQSTVPTGDTLQPTPGVVQYASSRAPEGSGKGIPDPEKVREWYATAGRDLAIAFGNKDAAREKRIKDLTTAISASEDEISLIRASGDSAKLEQKLRFHTNNIKELDNLTNGQFSAQREKAGVSAPSAGTTAAPAPAQAAVTPAPAQAAVTPAQKELTQDERNAARAKIASTPGLAAEFNKIPVTEGDARMRYIERVALESRPKTAAPAEAKGQTGVGASPDPEFQKALDFAKKERPNDPDFAKVTDMTSLRKVFPNTMNKYDKVGSRLPATPASTPASATPAPGSLEIAKELNWSDEDLRIFRKFAGPGAPSDVDIESDSTLIREHQKFKNLQVQLVNKFTTTLRQETASWRASDPKDKRISTRKALEYLAISDPNGPASKDPRFSAMLENYAAMGVDAKKAQIAKIKSEANLHDAQAEAVVSQALAAKALGLVRAAEVKNESAKLLFENSRGLLEATIKPQMEALAKAKDNDPQQYKVLLSRVSDSLANDPALSSIWKMYMDAASMAGGSDLEAAQAILLKGGWFGRTPTDRTTTLPVYGSSPGSATGSTAEAEGDAWLQANGNQ